MECWLPLVFLANGVTMEPGIWDPSLEVSLGMMQDGDDRNPDFTDKKQSP
jgi:hypothetical protein